MMINKHACAHKHTHTHTCITLSYVSYIETYFNTINVTLIQL